MLRTTLPTPAPQHGKPQTAVIPSSSSPNLQTLPTEILLQIITHVHDAGQHHTQALAQTSKRIAAVVRQVGPYGSVALPAALSRRAKRPANRGIALTHHHRSGRLTLRKTSDPGDAFVLFDRCVASTSAYWRFRIDRFCGHRIEIGVATPSAMGFGTVERKKSWSFDCFGRACIAGKRVAYGRQMREGDIVGMLYDASTSTLSFLDDGVCMGVVNVSARINGLKTHLLPFVYLPYLEGECVTLLEGVGPLEVRSVRERGRWWQRPVGLPYDRAVIVQTWDPKVWYAVRVNTDRTSLTQFWDIVESRHGIAKQFFELIHDGTRLPDTDKFALCDFGIKIDNRSGTCGTDVILSVPHIVS